MSASRLRGQDHAWNRAHWRRVHGLVLHRTTIWVASAVGEALVRKGRLKKILDGDPGNGNSSDLNAHAQMVGYLDGVHTSVVSGGAWEPHENPDVEPRPPSHALTTRTENIARTVGYGCFGKAK